MSPVFVTVALGIICLGNSYFAIYWMHWHKELAVEWIYELAAYPLYNWFSGICSLEIAPYNTYNGFSGVCSLDDPVCVHLSVPTAVLSAAITACHGNVKQMYLYTTQAYPWLNVGPRKQGWMLRHCPHLWYVVAMLWHLECSLPWHLNMWPTDKFARHLCCTHIERRSWSAPK